MKLNRMQLRRLIESAILEQEGGSTSGSDRAAAGRNTNLNPPSQLSMPADNDLGVLGKNAFDEKANTFTVPAGKSVKFISKAYYDYGGTLENIDYLNPESLKRIASGLVVHVNGEKVNVDTETDNIRIFYTGDIPPTKAGITLNWHIKNNGNEDVILHLPPPGP